jgi:hypothetical protein
LVVVDAYNSVDEIGGMAFTTTTIEAGKTKTVNLDLGDKYAAFDQFLAERYGIVTEPGRIAILGAAGGYYVDFLAGSTPDPPFGTLSFPAYDTWYNSATVLNPAGDEIDKTGNRKSITADPFVIEGVLPGRTWRLMITSYSDRTTPAYTFYLSEPFTTNSGEMSSVDFASGFGSAFTAYDIC